jgi:hypothetical protein
MLVLNLNEQKVEMPVQNFYKFLINPIYSNQKHPLMCLHCMHVNMICKLQSIGLIESDLFCLQVFLIVLGLLQVYFPGNQTHLC